MFARYGVLERLVWLAAALELSVPVVVKSRFGIRIFFRVLAEV